MPKTAVQLAWKQLSDSESVIALRSNYVFEHMAIQHRKYTGLYYSTDTTLLKSF